MKKNQPNRVTINLPEKVLQWAEELMAARGFENRSSYFADLIRRDKERQEEKERERANDRTSTAQKSSTPQKLPKVA
jgi:Arc/MetJ-type ribon-helix-helix transcriptional regulator